MNCHVLALAHNVVLALPAKGSEVQHAAAHGVRPALGKGCTSLLRYALGLLKQAQV